MMNHPIRALMSLLFLAALAAAPAVQAAGPIKKGLAEAHQEAKAIDQAISDYMLRLDGMRTTVNQTGGAAMAGTDQLYLYVLTKLGKEGKTIKEVSNDPISSIADSQITDFLNGIESLGNDAVTSIEKYKNFVATDGAAFVERIEALQEKLKNIEELINAGGSAWVKTKKYKEKVKAQGKDLNTLQGQVEKMKTTLQEAHMIGVPSAAKTLKVLPKGSDTLGKLEELASRGTKGTLKDYAKFEGELGKTSRKMRDYMGDFDKQLKNLEEMVETAEAIEKENND